MTFAIKAEIRHASAEALSFIAHKTMYGGKQITAGDPIFIFASENEAGHGLLATGVVTSAERVARTPRNSALISG